MVTNAQLGRLINNSKVNFSKQQTLGSIKDLGMDDFYEDVLNFIADSNNAFATVERASFWAMFEHFESKKVSISRKTLDKVLDKVHTKVLLFLIV